MSRPRNRLKADRRLLPGPLLERLEGRALPTSFTMTSPTAAGPLPGGVTEVGGVVLDLVGLNGSRVVSQVSAPDLFRGNFRTGSPAGFRGNPGTIGERSGFDPEVVDALGGGLAELAVRLTVFDGDTGPGDFDDGGQNTLRINGEPVGCFDEVATEETDQSGRTTRSTNPDGGFRDGRLDTGFFHLTEPGALARIFGSIREAGSAAFQLLDDDPFDNHFDFTVGLDGGQLGGDRPPGLENRPPVFESLGPDAPVREGAPSRFVAVASDPDPGDVLTFEFDLDGDGLFEIRSPFNEATATFPDDGPVTISARVRDGRGGVSSTSTTVVVANVAPSVQAPGDQRSAEGGEGAFRLGSFADPGAEGTWTVTVDWGDGSVLESFQVDSPGPLGVRPHRYDQDGTYEVVVSVSDGEGPTEARFGITVANVAPAVQAPGDQRSAEGSAVAFDLGRFADPGAEGRWAVTVDWGDGSAAESFEVASPGPLGARPHRYERDGTYQVTVSVADGADTTDSAFLVSVANVAPRLIAPGAQRADEGEAVPILLGSFADPGAEGTWTVTVDWGDGSPLESFEVDSPGLLPPRAHRYGQDGTYEVRVSVADGRAEAGSTFLVSVANVPPTLLVPAGQEASEGAEVPLLLGSFADPGAEGRWVVTVDWGDGSAAESFEVDSPGPLGVRPHRFERDGAYELTVRVADGSGQGESTSRILVRNEPPRLGNAWASSRVEAGAPIDLFATFSDPGRLDTFSALIDWGDGTTSRIDLGVGSTSVTSRHVIDRAGSFRITLTLADDRGAASTVSLPVTVFVPDPLTPPGPGPGPVPIGPPSLPAFPGLSADQILAIGLLSPPVGSLPGLPGAGSPGASATAAPPLGPSIGTLQGPSAGGAGPGPTAPDLPPALSPLATPEEAPTPPPPAADAVSGAEATVEGAVDSSQAPQLAGGGQDLGADEQAIQATFQETGFSAEEAPAPALAAAGPAPGGGSAPSQDAPAATGTRMMMLLLALICLRRQRPLTARRLTGAALQGGKD